MSRQSQPLSLKRRILSLPTLLAFAIAGAFIAFLATRFDLDWGQTWDNVRSLNPWLYIVALALYYLSFAFRGLRWKILAANAASAEGSGHELRLPSVSRFSQFILVGWFVNAISWFRLGDAYRAYAFADESKGSFSWSLGTVLAERVLDMVVISVLIIASVFAVSASFESDASRYLLIAAVVMAVALVALLALMRGYGRRLAMLLPARLQGAYDRFHQGTLGSVRRMLPALVLLSLIGWVLEACRLYFVVQALHMDIGLPMVMLVSLGHAILSTVPTPGGVGAVEPGLTGLLVLSFDRHDAASITLVDRSITLVSVIVFGGLLFLYLQVARSRERKGDMSLAAQPSDGAG